jgi:hypothetical protein
LLCVCVCVPRVTAAPPKRTNGLGFGVATRVAPNRVPIGTDWPPIGSLLFRVLGLGRVRVSTSASVEERSAEPALFLDSTTRRRMVWLRDECRLSCVAATCRRCRPCARSAVASRKLHHPTTMKESI